MADTKLVFWNAGSPQLVNSTRKVTLPNGDVVFNAKADPEIDLYEYVEAGNDPTQYETVSAPTYDNDGWTITATYTKSLKPLADIQAMRIAEVKAAAGARILTALPDWKQRNLTARQSELQAIRSGNLVQSDGTFADARALTAGETAELVAIKAAWDWVVSVRAASDDFETAITAAADSAAAVAVSVAWPADFGAGQ